MKILTVFNNKGGVGKTTLTFHLAHALSEIGKKVLILDLDPQCNLTIYSLSEEDIAEIWVPEDSFIEDFKSSREALDAAEFEAIASKPRSIHFTLKPIEDGTAELADLPPPVHLAANLDLIPGRLTLHMFESKVAERFNGVYSGDPLAIRTATSIRSISHEYSKKYGYDVVILDTSPSLGALNRNILSQADAFIIPANPDLFSLYGIRNIGAALSVWRKQFDSVYSLLSDAKREFFPKKFVQFIGYTLYNAKKLRGKKSTNELGLAQAHYHYAQNIPKIIDEYIINKNYNSDESGFYASSIANGVIMYGHNTFPSMSQKYNLPMWNLPSHPGLESGDVSTIRGNRKRHEGTQKNYHQFAVDVIARLEAL